MARSSHAGQGHAQIVGLYLIITTSILNDQVVDLNEYFGVAGAIIFINRSRLELVRLDNLLELWCQSTKCASPW
jgi:hypothetical protein